MPEATAAVAAAYIRVSTEDQTEFSPDAQRKALLRYAHEHHMTLPPQLIFCDEGISGRKAEKRPGFLSMIALAKSKAHPFDVILVHKFDRFARSREDSVVYKSMLRKECGVRVISITESIEDDKFSIILESMLEAMAEYYSINLGDEVKKGMTEKALRGGLQSIPAYGYRAEENRLIPVPEEAQLVQQIFDRFLCGASCFSIAKWLNALGARTHRGGLFEGRSVEYILCNPVYIGKLRWNPAGRIRRAFDAPSAIIAPGEHPPLISGETWASAQQQMARLRQEQATRTRPTGEKQHWLCGQVRCAGCGRTLALYHYGKNRIPYFHCLGYVHGVCGSAQHIRADLLEEAVLSRLRLDCGCALPLHFRLKKAMDGAASQQQLLRRQMEGLLRRKERLKEAFLSGADSLQEYQDGKAAADASLTALRQQMDAVPEGGAVCDGLTAQIRQALLDLSPGDASPAQLGGAFSQIVESCTFEKKPRPVLIIHYRSLL